MLCEETNIAVLWNHFIQYKLGNKHDMTVDALKVKSPLFVEYGAAYGCENTAAKMRDNKDTAHMNCNGY